LDWHNGAAGRKRPAINKILRGAQYGGPNGEDRGWVIDWRFNSVEPINESINDSIANIHAEGDSFVCLPEFEPFKLIVEAHGGFGDGPDFAEITVDRLFIDRLIRLRRLCKENDLESASVLAHPDRWGNKDMKIINESLLVARGDWTDFWWFEGYPVYADYKAATSIIDIDDFLKIVDTGVADVLGFQWSNTTRTLFYAPNPERLPDLIKMVEKAA